MKLNILIGGKAGQGINKISEIVSSILNSYGYFTFNYRDYQSLISGGHNFNVLCVSDKRVGSTEGKFDITVALDDNTIFLHKSSLRKNGVIISYKKFEKDELGRNLNVALAGALIKVLGIDKEVLVDEIRRQFKNEESNKVSEKGYDSQDFRFNLEKLNNRIFKMNGSKGISQGAINSNIDLYLAYPMTPATGVMHELASNQIKNNLMVFQPENEIAVVNAGLGASFAGAKVMIGTSGGGYDLMTEGLSLQGQSEIPLVIYLCSRPGPATGVPTYTSQADLDIALRGGHGEFPRVVIAPGDPIECMEKTNEAFYLAEKFKTLSIVLSDKHLAESEFSYDNKPNKIISVRIKKKIPGKEIVKASSYECDKFGNTTESAEFTEKNANSRIEIYKRIKEEVKKFEMTKVYGKRNSKNLVIGWGSTKTAILDAIEGEDFKFLQVLYMKPLPDKIKKEIQKARKVILVEQNVTGQLGRLIREKTGIKIENRILKYDGRPFYCDDLKERLKKEVRG
jgi:2-oxoglutarate/2-oxoacid ferredoxin oxidoreductase subunit alpha